MFDARKCILELVFSEEKLRQREMDPKQVKVEVKWGRDAECHFVIAIRLFSPTIGAIYITKPCMRVTGVVFVAFLRLQEFDRLKCGLLGVVKLPVVVQ